MEINKKSFKRNAESYYVKSTTNSVSSPVSAMYDRGAHPRLESHSHVWKEIEEEQSFFLGDAELVFLQECEYDKVRFLEFELEEIEIETDDNEPDISMSRDVALEYVPEPLEDLEDSHQKYPEDIDINVVDDGFEAIEVEFLTTTYHYTRK